MKELIDTGTDELLCEISDRVCTLTLNRPNKKNALSNSLTPALRKMFLEIPIKKNINCVVITGSGDSFCAGGDIGGMNENAKNKNFDKKTKVNDLIKKQEELTLRLFDLNLPTIAILPGPAAGAGMCLALACDFRFMDSATFMTTAYRNIALSGDYGGSWLLPRLVGVSKAKELFFTGRRILANEALKIGMVDQVFSKEVLMEKAMEFAKTLAQGPKLAVGRMKKNLNESLVSNIQDNMKLEAVHLIQCMDEEDHKGAVKAFLEKKAPAFNLD